jgi:hypothetical protein
MKKVCILLLFLLSLSTYGQEASHVIDEVNKGDYSGLEHFSIISHQPSGTTFPDGGMNTIVDGVNRNDYSSQYYTENERWIRNLDRDLTHTFQLQSRYKQLDGSYVFYLSNIFTVVEKRLTLSHLLTLSHQWCQSRQLNQSLHLNILQMELLMELQ